MIRLIGGATSEKKGEGTADIPTEPVRDRKFIRSACLPLEYQMILRQSIARLRRAFQDHDLGHDFVPHKTPRPIACRAFILREKFFDCVVIQRWQCHAGGLGKIDTIMPTTYYQ